MDMSRFSLRVTETASTTDCTTVLTKYWVLSYKYIAVVQEAKQPTLASSSWTAQSSIDSVGTSSFYGWLGLTAMSTPLQEAMSMLRNSGIEYKDNRTTKKTIQRTAHDTPSVASQIPSVMM